MRNRQKIGDRARWVVAISLCVSVVGCNSGGMQVGASSATHSNSSPTVSPSSDRDAWVEEVAWRNHIDDPPAVPIIREIRPDERDATNASCMIAAGFPPNKGTLTIWDVPPGQVKAFDLAMYTCEVSYPLAAKYRQPMNLEQLKIVYDYYGHELAACIGAQGFRAPDLPSFEQFQTSAGTSDEYNPWALIPVEYTEGVWKECDPLPPDDELYPG